MWGVVGVDLGANVVHDDRLYILFGDVAVAHGQQRMNSDLIAWSTDTEVLERGGHRASQGSWEFLLPNLEHGASPTTGQPDWRFCGKCHGLFWAQGGSGQGSRCAYDSGEHAPNGLNFVLPNDFQGTGHLGQLGWRFCGNCHGLCWSPNGEVPVGSCPAGGRLSPVGWIFAPPNDHQGGNTDTGQGAWRFCGGCEGMFFDGYAGKGICPGSLDDNLRPIPNGGGILLEAVRAGDDFFPLTATDPVGMTTDLETPGGAFSHDGRLYAFVNISHPRWSKQERPGDPAFGTYLISSGAPDRAEPFVTEYQFSPRIGACDRADVRGHDPRPDVRRRGEPRPRRVAVLRPVPQHGPHAKRPWPLLRRRRRPAPPGRKPVRPAGRDRAARAEPARLAALWRLPDRLLRRVRHLEGPMPGPVTAGTTRGVWSSCSPSTASRRNTGR